MGWRLTLFVYKHSAAGDFDKTKAGSEIPFACHTCIVLGTFLGLASVGGLMMKRPTHQPVLAQ